MSYVEYHKKSSLDVKTYLKSYHVYDVYILRDHETSIEHMREL